MADRLNHPRTLAWEPIDSEHILACARAPYIQVQHIVERAGKGKWVQYLKDKAKHDCCRNPLNLDIEAWFSKAEERDKGAPDVYKLYCRVCEGIHQQDGDRGYCHAVFCVGGTHATAKGFSRAERPDLYDVRPFWEIR